ncbi:hypothetical protein BLNAU_15933 [Blattamonas nauphoetae]|uniref:Uncharacterized protein n=1 Tax=Blattamonas nauphoetae TaxID=2049346 RepID=A0ABQ9XEM8_9EUKA|nr:hypothetical protein BLNAU_15933 [Blattamonas nauphoetae]
MQSLEDSEEFQSPDGTSFMSNHPWSKTNTSPLASPLHTPSYTVDPASTAHLSKSEYGGLGMSVFEGTAASEDVLKADSFFLTPNTTRHERYALDETGDSFPANMTLNDVLRLEQQLIQSPEPTQTHPNPAASPTGATQATSSLIEQSVASDHSQNPLPARAGTTIPTLPSKTLSEGEPDDYDNGRKSRVLNTTAKKSKSIPSRPKTAIGEIRSQRAVPKREEKMTNPKERKKVGEEKKFVSRVAVKKGQQQDPKAPSKENQKVQPKETPKTQQKTVVFVEEKSNAVERGEEAEEKGVSSKHASQRHLDLVKQQTPNDSPSESLNSTLDSLLRGVEEERSEEELPPLLGNNEAHKDGNDDPLDQGSIETVQTEPASESESESESESDSDGITQQPPPAASSHPSPHPSPQLSAPPTIAVASRPSKIPTLSPRPRKSESSHPIAFPDVEKARQKQEKDSSGPQKSHSNPTSSIKPSPKHSQTISDISSLKTGPKPKARQTTSLQNTKSKAKQAASPTTSSKSVEPVPKPEQKLTKPLRRPSASGPAHSDRPTTAKSARAEGPNTARTQRSESQTESLKNRASVTSLPGLRTSLDLSRQSISSISKSKSPLLTDRSRNSINGDMAGSEEDNAPKVFFSLSPLKMQKAERDKRIEQRASMDKESVKGETPAEAPVKVAPKPKPKKEIRKMSEINARDYLRQMRKKKSEN